MIDISDNTATNMLIRLVGRHTINRSMNEPRLGTYAHLTDDIRTGGWNVRRQLRTSPADLVRLLALMAQRRLVDEWSSNEMISILEQDQYYALLTGAAAGGRSDRAQDQLVFRHPQRRRNRLPQTTLVRHCRHDDFTANAVEKFGTRVHSLPISRLAYTDEEFAWRGLARERAV